MGHFGNLRDEYRDLLKRLDAGQVGLPVPSDPEARQGLRDILEILYTPEEAELASKLPVRPSSLKKISERTGLSVETLRDKLDAMCDKGIVMDIVNPRTGKIRYALSPPVVGFFEFSLMRIRDGIPKKRMAEALDAYTRGDPAFSEHVFGGETVLGRSLVHENTIPDDLPDVLSWERADSIIMESHKVAVSTCYCRHKAEHLGEECNAPQELCLTVGAGAEFVARRGFGRAIEKEEALEMLKTAREHGLVHIADNVKNRPTFICNCCACCCGQLSAINSYGLKAVNPSGFQPEINTEKCKGCGKCARACPVGAISMVSARKTGIKNNDLVPAIEKDQCIGCGLCPSACKKKCISMIRRDNPPYVPENTIERVVRMAIERGNLANLLVDAGQSRGYTFLNSLLNTIVKLPPSRRLLAEEQVKSRFLSYILKSG